jgi:hypothetical protein
MSFVGMRKNIMSLGLSPKMTRQSESKRHSSTSLNTMKAQSIQATIEKMREAIYTYLNQKKDVDNIDKQGIP